MTKCRSVQEPTCSAEHNIHQLMHLENDLGRPETLSRIRELDSRVSGQRRLTPAFHGVTNVTICFPVTMDQVRFDTWASIEVIAYRLQSVAYLQERKLPQKKAEGALRKLRADTSGRASMFLD